MEMMTTPQRPLYKGKPRLRVRPHVGVIAFGNAIGNTIAGRMQAKPKSYSEGDTYTNKDGITSLVGSVDENSQPTVLVNAAKRPEPLPQETSAWDIGGELFENRELYLGGVLDAEHERQEMIRESYIARLGDPGRDAISSVPIHPLSWIVDGGATLYGDFERATRDFGFFSQQTLKVGAGVAGEYALDRTIGRFVPDDAFSRVGDFFSDSFTKVGNAFSNQPFRERINDLSSADQLLIKEVSTFNTLGVSNADAYNYVTGSPDGQLMMNLLRQSDPSASEAILTSRAIDYVRSGTSLPTAMEIDTPLLKLVPSGGELTGYSPFFTTQRELDLAVQSGRSFTDYFGLPAVNDANRYGVFEITPHSTATIFSSQVAPTTELRGLFKTNAGGLQMITPQRSQFTDPVFIEVIKNNSGY